MREARSPWCDNKLREKIQYSRCSQYAQEMEAGLGRVAEESRVSIMWRELIFQGALD
jgi:hypothetical protein